MLFINFLCLYCLIVLANCHTISKSIAYGNNYDEPGKLKEYDYLSDYPPRYERHNKPRKEERIHKATKQNHGNPDTIADITNSPTMPIIDKENDQPTPNSLTGLWRNLRHKKRLTKIDPSKLDQIDRKSLYDITDLEKLNTESISKEAPSKNQKKSSKLRSVNKRGLKSSNKGFLSNLNGPTVYSFMSIKTDQPINTGKSHNYKPHNDKPDNDKPHNYKPHNYKPTDNSQVDANNFVNIDGKTVCVISEINKPAPEEKAYNLSTSNPVLVTSVMSVPASEDGDNIGPIEDLLNSIKAKVVEILTDHSSHLHEENMVSNSLTATTFKMDPTLFAGFTSLPFSNEKTTFNKIEFNITSLSDDNHPIQVRCCKDLKAIKCMCNNIIHKVSEDFKNEIRQTAKAIKSITSCHHSTPSKSSTTENKTKKKPCAKDIVESGLIQSTKSMVSTTKVTTPTITTVKTSHQTGKSTKHDGKKVRQANETISRIWKRISRNRFRATRNTTPRSDDDYILLSLYEQMLTKSDQVNRLGVTAPVKRSYNSEKALLSKRNTETLTDLSLKENIQDIFNDGEVMPEIFESGQNNADNNIKSNFDDTTDKEKQPEGINIEGLSEKLAYKDYINGYKYYLKFQKELKNENFSDLIKYQAHRHHNVDDIGKYILEKLPQVPKISRSKRRFFDDDTMDDQDVSTRSEDSWFKKHFYFFIDNGPPKKFHTSQTVPLKSHAKSTTNSFEEDYREATEYINKMKHIRRARSIDATTSSPDLVPQNMTYLITAITRSYRESNLSELLDKIALWKRQWDFSKSEENQTTDPTENKMKWSNIFTDELNTEKSVNVSSTCCNGTCDACGLNKCDEKLHDIKHNTPKDKSQNDPNNKPHDQLKDKTQHKPMSLPNNMKPHDKQKEQPKDKDDDKIIVSNCKRSKQKDDAIDNAKKRTKTKRSLQNKPQRFHAFKHLKNMILGDQSGGTAPTESDYLLNNQLTMFKVPNIDTLFEQIPNITDLESAKKTDSPKDSPKLSAFSDFGKIQKFNELWTPKHSKTTMKHKTTASRPPMYKKPRPKQFYPMSRFVTTKAKNVDQMSHDYYIDDPGSKFRGYGSPFPRLLFHFHPKHDRVRPTTSRDKQGLFHDLLGYNTMSSQLYDYNYMTTTGYEPFEKYYRMTDPKISEKERNKDMYGKNRDGDMESYQKSKIVNEDDPNIRYVDYGPQSNMIERDPLLRMFEMPTRPKFKSLKVPTKKMYGISKELTNVAEYNDLTSHTIPDTTLPSRETYKQSFQNYPYKLSHKNYPYKQGYKNDLYKQPYKNDPYKQVYQNDPYKQVYKNDPYKQVYQNDPYKQVSQNDPYKQGYNNDQYKQAYKNAPYKQSYKNDPYKEPYKNDPYQQGYNNDQYKQAYKNAPYKQSYKNDPYNEHKRPYTTLRTQFKTKTHKDTLKPLSRNKVYMNKAIDKEVPVFPYASNKENKNHYKSHKQFKSDEKEKYKETIKDSLNDMYDSPHMVGTTEKNRFSSISNETMDITQEFEDFYNMNSDILQNPKSFSKLVHTTADPKKMLKEVDDMTDKINMDFDTTTIDIPNDEYKNEKPNNNHRKQQIHHKTTRTSWKTYRTMTPSIKVFHYTLIVDRDDPKVDQKRLIEKNLLDGTREKLKEAKEMFNQMKTTIKDEETTNIFESDMTKNNFQNSDTANKMVVDTTLLAYDDGADVLTTEQDSASDSVLKTDTKKNTAPKHYFSTPVPMKYNEFQNFLKENYLDLFLLTSPLENVPRLHSFDLKHRLYASPTKIIKMDRQFSKDSQKADVNTLASKTNRIKQFFHMTSPANNTSNVTEMTKVTLFRDISLMQDKKLKKRHKNGFYETEPNGKLDKIDDIEDDIFTVAQKIENPNSTYDAEKEFNSTNGFQNPVEEITQRSPNRNYTIKMKSPQKGKHIRYKTYKKTNPFVMYPLPLSEHKMITRQQRKPETHNSLLYNEGVTSPYNFGTIATKELHISEASTPDHEFTTFYSHHGPAVRVFKGHKSHPKHVLFSDHVCKFDVISNDKVHLPKRRIDSDYESADLEGSNYSVTNYKAPNKLLKGATTKSNEIRIDLPTYYLPNTEPFQTNLVLQKKLSWHDHIVRCISGLALVELLNKYGFIKTFDGPHDKNLNTTKVFSENYTKRYMEVTPSYSQMNGRRGRYLHNDLFKKLQETRRTGRTASSGFSNYEETVGPEDILMEENETNEKDEEEKCKKKMKEIKEECKKEQEECDKEKDEGKKDKGDSKKKKEKDECKKEKGDNKKDKGDRKKEKDTEKCKKDSENCGKDDEKNEKDDESCEDDEKNEKDKKKSEKDREKNEKDDDMWDDDEKDEKDNKKCDKDREKNEKDDEKCEEDEKDEKDNKKCDKDDEENEKESEEKKKNNEFGQEDYNFDDYNKGHGGQGGQGGQGGHGWRLLNEDEPIVKMASAEELLLKTNKPDSEDDDDGDIDNSESDLDDVKVSMAYDPESRDDINVNFEKIIIEKGFKVFSKKRKDPQPVDNLPPPPKTTMEDNKYSKKGPPHYSYRTRIPNTYIQETKQTPMRNEADEHSKALNEHSKVSEEHPKESDERATESDERSKESAAHLKVTDEHLKELRKELELIFNLHEEVLSKLNYLKNKFQIGFSDNKKPKNLTRNKREKNYEHSIRNTPQTYTAKDVSALEVIVDLVKNYESESDDIKSLSTKSVNERSNDVRFALQNNSRGETDNSSLELHIFIPSNFGDNKKRAPNPLRIRKVFSAIMSTPVDIEYQIRNFVDEAVIFTTAPTVIENHKWKTEETIKVSPVSTNNQIIPESDKNKPKPEQTVTFTQAQNDKNELKFKDTTVLSTSTNSPSITSQLAVTDNIVSTVKAFTLTTPTKVFTLALTGATFTPSLLTTVRRSVDTSDFKKAEFVSWQHVTDRGINLQQGPTEAPLTQAVLQTGSPKSKFTTESSAVSNLKGSTLPTILHVSISSPKVIDNARSSTPKTLTATESSINVLVTLSNPELMNNAATFLHETASQPSLFKLTSKIGVPSYARRSSSVNFGKAFPTEKKMYDLSELVNATKPSSQNSDTFKHDYDEDNNNIKETLRTAEAVFNTQTPKSKIFNALHSYPYDKIMKTSFYTLHNDKTKTTNFTAPKIEKFSPISMPSVEIPPNITTSKSLSSGRVTLSKEFIAAVDDRVIQLFLNLTKLQNKGLLNTNKVKRDIQNTSNVNKLDWQDIKKVLKRDASCGCKCRDNKVMCRSCAASDAVLTHLVSEFDNLARFLNDHCSEMQAYLYKNPTGRRKLREILHRIEKSVNAYESKQNGKCEQRCSNITDNNIKINTEDMYARNDSNCFNFQQLFALANNLNNAINLDVCPTKNLTKSAKSFYDRAKTCLMAESTPYDTIKNIYSLDKINVNIICKPNEPTENYTTTETLFETKLDTTLETNIDTKLENKFDTKLDSKLDTKLDTKDLENLERNEVSSSEATYSTTKKMKGIRNLFFRTGTKHKPTKMKYPRNYLVNRDTGVWIPVIKTKKKRNTDFDNQLEPPIITDSGGSFWHEYINNDKRNGRVPARNFMRRYSPKIKKHLFKCHRQVQTTPVLKSLSPTDMEFMTTVTDGISDIEEATQTFYNVNIFGTVNPKRNESATTEGCLCGSKSKTKIKAKIKTYFKSTSKRSMFKITRKETDSTTRKPKTSKSIGTKTTMSSTKIEVTKKKEKWKRKSSTMTTTTKDTSFITSTTTPTTKKITPTPKSTTKATSFSLKIWKKILSTFDIYHKHEKANFYNENAIEEFMDSTEAFDSVDYKRSANDPKKESNLLLSIYLYKKRLGDNDRTTTQMPTTTQMTTLQPTTEMTTLQSTTEMTTFQYNATDLLKQSAKMTSEMFPRPKVSTPMPNGRNLDTIYPEIHTFFKKVKSVKKKVVPETKENDQPLIKHSEDGHFKDGAEEPDLDPEPRLICDLPATYAHIINIYTHLPQNKFENYVKNIKCFKYRPSPTVFRLKRVTSKLPRKLIQPKRAVKWNWIRNKRTVRIGQVRERDAQLSARGRRDFEEFVRDDSGVYRVKFERRKKRQSDVSEDEITSMDKEIFAHLGDTIEIKCEPDDPTPLGEAPKANEASWVYNGQLFHAGNVDVTGNVITVRSVQPFNDGEYYCKTNSMNKRVKLTVITLPSINIVYIPVYTSDSDCGNITKNFVFLDGLAREMSQYLCPSASHCSVNLHEPFCVRDPRFNKAHIQSTAIITMDPSPLTCSVECRKGLLSALSSLSANNFKHVFNTPVVITAGEYNHTLYPASKKEVYGFWRHSLEPYHNEKASRFGNYQLAKRANEFIMKSISNMSPGHVRVLAACPAGQYLVRRISVCAMCPANSWSLPGQNYCVSRPRDTRSMSALYNRTRRFGLSGTSIVYLLLYILAACTVVACVSVCVSRVRRRSARRDLRRLRSSVMDLPPRGGAEAYQYSTTSTRRRPLSPSRVILTRLFNSPTRRNQDAQEDKFKRWKQRNSRPPVPPVDFDW